MASRDLDSIATRMTVAETRLSHMESTLTGQREMVDRLLNVGHQNSRDIASMKGTIVAESEKVIALISAHAAEEADGRHKATSYAFWTLVTLVVAVGTTAVTLLID